MNKKFVIILAVILIVCFSAGAFTRLTLPIDTPSISQKLPSAMQSLTGYIKSDLLTVIAAGIFSATVILFPLVIILLAGKAFALGFSAVFLSLMGKDGLLILLTVLLPRGILKMPVYIALLMISLETSSLIRKNFKGGIHWKNLKAKLLSFVFCFLGLSLSSILEVCLLQAIL